jgi:hypothetical protein
MRDRHPILVCVWCRAPVQWSRFLDTHWCSDCRTDECTEVEVYEPEPEPREDGSDALN